MHEAAVAREIAEIVLQAAETNGLTAVSRVILAIGAFSCIQESMLRFAYQLVSENTLLSGSELVIETVAAEALCVQCQKVFSVTFTDRCCPLCGQESSQLLHGREAMIKEIEGE